MKLFQKTSDREFKNISNIFGKLSFQTFHYFSLTFQGLQLKYLNIQKQLFFFFQLYSLHQKFSNFYTMIRFVQFIKCLTNILMQPRFKSRVVSSYNLSTVIFSLSAIYRFSKKLWMFSEIQCLGQSCFNTNYFLNLIFSRKVRNLKAHFL